MFKKGKYRAEKLGNIECYFIKELDSRTDYSYFFIDNENGVLSIVSEYGKFGYMFGKMNDFKGFLKREPLEGIMRCLKGKSFDLEGTLENIKLWIIDHRKDKMCSKYEARKAWEDLEDVIKDYDYAVLNLDYFEGVLEKYDEDLERIDPDFRNSFTYLIEREWSWQDKYFMDNILKAFIEQLKRGVGAC